MTDEEKIARMQAAVTKGLESGVSDRPVKEVLQEARAKALAKAKANQRAARRSPG